MVGEKEFLEALEEGEGVGYVVMIKPRKVSKEKVAEKQELPKEIQKLLQTYEGIVSSGQPTTLPPKRAISHRIYLIPGVTLPNKGAYKVTPQQNEEIARQIQELLNQGLIRKSISPCAVPTVLAPKKGGEWRICTNSRQ